MPHLTLEYSDNLSFDVQPLLARLHTELVATGAINLTFNGLTAGTKYLGSVVYSGAVGMPTPTIVVVNP